MLKNLGIYVHIPFCASKCGYCDFYSLSGCDKKMPRYHNALINHIKEAGPQLRRFVADTVYFGGGTPSYYGAKRLCDIFNALKRFGYILKDGEVTVEANPDSMKLRDLVLLRSEGFNRISIGAQSSNDELLKVIGRRHSWKQVENAVKIAREAGFENISIDLMYGLPTQTKEDWVKTLDDAIKLKVDHISCYSLKLEEGTPMWSYKGSPVIPDDDEQADMYLYAVDILERFGYRQYEISNFSVPGKESRHNLKYWQLQDYIGFGPGAASNIGVTRYTYSRDLEQYISAFKNDDILLSEIETLTASDRASEYIMLGLRTRRGICATEFSRKYRGDFKNIEELLKDYAAKGWAVCEKDRWHFTPTGYLLSNTLIGLLLDKISSLKSFNIIDSENNSKTDSFVLPDDDSVYTRVYAPGEIRDYSET